MDTEKSTFTCPIASASADVLLTVIIGQGQLGATEVFRGDVTLVKGGVVIGMLNLGKGSDQLAVPISVESLVNDVSGQTNKMSVRYILENGKAQKEFVARHTVTNEGDMCSFVSTITFVVVKP
jgi:hypothetical protein